MKHLQHSTVAQKPTSQSRSRRHLLNIFLLTLFFSKQVNKRWALLKYKRRTSTTKVTTAATKCHDIDQNKQVVEWSRNWIHEKKVNYFNWLISIRNHRLIVGACDNLKLNFVYNKYNYLLIQNAINFFFCSMSAVSRDVSCILDWESLDMATGIVST